MIDIKNLIKTLDKITNIVYNNIYIIWSKKCMR
jgi:hypothetical protein